MAYFDYYRTNVESTSSANGNVMGTCSEMCPQHEVALREKERMVHVLEVMGPNRRLVKSFSRSAADVNMAVPSLLRPYNVLHKTVQYLLHEVTKRTDVPSSVLYDFLNDRLRAVRQDMTIQRLPPNHCVELLEQMIRFYVYYGYKLCELPLKDYDPVLNKKYLLECLKWYLSCCEDITQKDSSDTADQLSACLSNLSTNVNKNNRVLVESLYILCNLEDVHPIVRFLNLPKHLKKDPSLQLAYRIATANSKGNFVKVCKLMDELSPLAYCALCLYIPILQGRALLILSHGYSSKQLSVPLAALARWLRASPQDAEAVCRHYGLCVHGKDVYFAKTQFAGGVDTLPPKKLLDIEKKYDLSPDKIFT